MTQRRGPNSNSNKEDATSPLPDDFDDFGLGDGFDSKTKALPAVQQPNNSIRNGVMVIVALVGMGASFYFMILPQYMEAAEDGM